MFKWTAAAAPPDRGSLMVKEGDARLHANESPFPPPQAVVDAMAEAARTAHRYPDPEGARLRSALAAFVGVPSRRIVLGSGSGDLIEHIVQGLAGVGNEVVLPTPSFPLYGSVLARTPATRITVPIRPDGSLDLPALGAAVTERTSLVVLCNPNNPTGGYVPTPAVAEFLDALPDHVVVLLDEAYWEFTAPFLAGEDGSRPLLDRFPQLIITRTFSKYFALAGLRIGYALTGSDEMAAQIQRHKSTVFVNQLALAAARAALDCHPIYRRLTAGIAAERDRLYAALADLGLSPFPTQTNFVTFRYPWTEDIFAPAHIRIRSGQSLGMPGYARITVGTADDNRAALAVLTARTHQLAEQTRPDGS